MRTRSIVGRFGAVLTLTVGAVLGPTAPRAQAAAVGEVGCYIQGTYHVFLGRSPVADEVVSWADAIGNGIPRSTITEQLANSEEWLGGVVDGLYRGALDRTPDGAGRRYWTDQLRRGVLVNKLGTSVYASPEFFERAGSTEEGFVRDLYRRILHREADPAGVRYWIAELDASSRSDVAWAFFSSPESRRDRVVGLYGSILGRTPDSSGLSYWMTRLLTENDVRLAVNLASGDEFYDKTIVPQNGCALPPDWRPA